MKTAYLTCAALTALLTTLPASAETMRCGSGYIVRIGDNKSDVLQNCGEPVMRDTFCATTGTGSTQPAVNGACSNVDEWTYNPGTGQFMTTLRFFEGRLQSIRYGSRAR
ncbi:hypothetical protein ACS15_2283 [Ralstonia insidiosa]|uniref:DUF2845 domain-containing protein n=1 Tax=Ralstonia insidiosa TaxID=190721 RepID=A0AAC9BCH7_9RALS|nr:MULTISPECIES: DUF2845 domain-containing protein [Ralstonia]ANH71341.1 hypothetical protein ACS15_2283 [Ralstonia insidiosa]EPX98492.1 hypothetical protein C404_08080 [Ralstonia sp. AU12-08]MBY4704659.1 DUF2845 domain-containing protein [Ralstonia insidiosa]GAQ30444.1 hypothetical protein SAMD00023378_4127 [Ralstonia sp. NT80]